MVTLAIWKRTHPNVHIDVRTHAQTNTQTYPWTYMLHHCGFQLTKYRSALSKNQWRRTAHLDDGRVYVTGERQHHSNCHDDSERWQTQGNNGKAVIKSHVLLRQPATVDEHANVSLALLLLPLLLFMLLLFLLAALLHQYAPRHGLRSAGGLLLDVPRVNLERFGRRAFACAGPTLWNKLPANIRGNGNHPQFKKLLKTFLFST